MKTIEMIFLKKPYSIKSHNFTYNSGLLNASKQKLNISKAKIVPLLRQRSRILPTHHPYFANSSRLKSPTITSLKHCLQNPIYYFPNENTIKDILKILT